MRICEHPQVVHNISLLSSVKLMCPDLRALARDIYLLSTVPNIGPNPTVALHHVDDKRI